MQKKINALFFINLVIIFICSLIIQLSCSSGNSSSSQDDTRPFYMGFSPWAYEETAEAVDWVYDKIKTEGDIVSHHMEEGIPWQEAYDDTPFSTSYQNEIDSRVNRKEAGQKILLQINPLNNARDGKALYRNDNINQSLPPLWDGYALDSNEVKTAYLNYAKRMVEYFEPDYLLIGVEVNLLVRNNYALWPEYVNLQNYTYTELKKDYPNLPISISVFCVPYFDEWSSEDDTDLQLQALAQIEPYLDFVSFSVHPFMSALQCEMLPDNYMSRLFAVTDKPVAIAESSYSAQVWSSSSFTFNGSQEKQKQFTDQMLTEASNRNAYYVIWFSVRDYDKLWNDTLGSSEEALVWRDTGLYDEDGNARLAHSTWMDIFNNIYSP